MREAETIACSDVMARTDGRIDRHMDILTVDALHSFKEAEYIKTNIRFE